MATKSHFKNEHIGRVSPYAFHPFRTTLETFMYQNNVLEVATLQEAYLLAKSEPGTIVLDQDIVGAEALGLAEGSKVLVFNDAAITGRQAKARELITDTTRETYSAMVRDHLFGARKRTFYKATAYVGLHENFMVKAHLMVPEGYANTLYSWLLNFQVPTQEWDALYARSTVFEEGDIILFSDPEREGDPLALFDEHYNAAALFGLPYFGEHKKGTLTLAWSIASRHGYISAHGGLKKITRPNEEPYVMSVFGLSGSGKSTITHAKSAAFPHAVVLHDDAYVLDQKSKETIALEPSYFDKVADYPTASKDNAYLLTMQNVGVTRNNEGALVPVTEDIRCGNGRAVKSVLWTDNRVHHVKEPLNAIFWIMRDDALPPLTKINDPILAATLGATLATKRSSAEHGVDTTKLAFVPYANPFRLYPLEKDYQEFKRLFEEGNVACYVLNTGHYADQKIPPKTTLGLLDQLLQSTLTWQPFGHQKYAEAVNLDAFPLRLEEKDLTHLKARLTQRIDFLEALSTRDQLPLECKQALTHWMNDLSIK